MNQVMQGIVAKPYSGLGRERTISLSFVLRGYGTLVKAISLAEKVYKKTFLHDFQNVLASRVV